MAEETRFGKYVGDRARQVGEILRADIGVVRAGIRSFVAKKLRNMDIAKNARIMAEEQIKLADNPKSRSTLSSENQKIYDKNNQANEPSIAHAESERKALEKRKEERVKAKEGFREIHKTRIEKKGKLSAEREDLRMNKELLRSAEAEQLAAQEAYDEAKAEEEDAKKKYEAAREKYDDVAGRKAKADERVTKLKGRQEVLESVMSVQEEIGNRSPAIIKENLENEINRLKEQRSKAVQPTVVHELYELTEKSLSEEGKEGSLSEEDINKVKNRALKYYDQAYPDDKIKIEELELQLKKLEVYEEVKKSLAARSGIRSAFSGLRARIAASLFSSSI